MARLTEKEKAEIKMKLLNAIEKAMEEITHDDNNLGWLPNDYEAMMADAAFNTLDAINATNAFIEAEGMMK